MFIEKSLSRRNFMEKSALFFGSMGTGFLFPKSFFGNTRLSSIEQIEVKNSPRTVRVLSVSVDGIYQDENIVDKVVERIERMSSHQPDIICLPEAFATTAETAEELNGPILKKICSVAKEIGCYIICPVHLKKNFNIFNTAVLIDRNGNIAGQYDKIYPTDGECDMGIKPGKFPPPVFKTDFGTIGILICYDVNWIDAWRSLNDQGAEIVFWTAAYPGGRMLPSYAWMFNYYVVGCSRRNPASIYDISGDNVDNSGTYEPWAFATLNLEKILCEIDFHNKKIRAIRKKYGNKVIIKYYHDEDWVTIESNSPDLTIKQLIDEYDLIFKHILL